MHPHKLFISADGPNYKQFGKESGDFDEEIRPTSRRVVIATALVSLILLMCVAVFTFIVFRGTLGRRPSFAPCLTPARPVPSVHFDQWRGREQNGTSLEPLLPEEFTPKLVSRDEWQDPNSGNSTESDESLDLPVSYVVIQHTATRICDTQDDCILFMRTMEEIHIGGGPNFLIGGDGTIFEGKGWDKKGMSNSSLVITFIGEFVTELPRKPQQVACEYLLEEGIKRGKVKEEYDLNDSPRFPKAGSPGIMVMQRFLRSQPDYQSDEDYNQTSP